MNQHQSHHELVAVTDGGPLLAVSPRVAINVRAGTLADVAFMDSLQKATTRQVGWMPTKQFAGKIAAGHVLVAEGATLGSPASVGARTGGDTGKNACATAEGETSLAPTGPVGYLIGNDQYFKRDDVGIIYQMNVVPAYRRSLVAATLLKAQFERSAYGCKLYCCWCAQDIEANRFWESMGFVPLAFRSGSRTKGKGGAARTHIFWQKRIRQGDESTPWWFPSKTAGGALNEDRIVLPIPPGVSWRDEMPVLLPNAGEELPIEDGRSPNEEKAARRRGRVVTGSSSNRQSLIAKRQSSPPVRARVQFGPPGMMPIEPVAEKPAEPVAVEPSAMMLAKPRRKAKKADPAMIAAARELRDRWLDEVNAGRFLPAGNGKYAVGRAIGGPAADATRLLPAA
jgi:hypothetical protein